MASESSSGTPDLLSYAFSKEGSLDPRTKLLDMGFDRCTPVDALRMLLDEPLRMSVALHELTHFESLESPLGHAMGFLAMRASMIAAAIENTAQQDTPIDNSWISIYAAWHLPYRALLELWRPLLEGFAVYAQLHQPNTAADDVIQPLLALLVLQSSVTALSDEALDAVKYHRTVTPLLDAAYIAIHRGPQLRCGDEPLATAFEFLRPNGLKPYFLGYAYIRALHIALSRKHGRYASSERFFGLVLRILRSSTHVVLRHSAGWDQPGMATRVYGWIDLVRAAPPARVAALVEQNDAVDVLHFLATGEERRGYQSSGTGAVASLRELLPDFWNYFESELGRTSFDAIAEVEGDPPPTFTGAEMAERLVLGWLQATMTLNFSSNGQVQIVGWIPDGLGPSHALAMRVENATWWLAARDEDIALLIGDTETVPLLPPSALGGEPDLPMKSRSLVLDCYVRYVAANTVIPSHPPDRMLPTVLFGLTHPADPTRTLQAEIASGEPGGMRAHLRVVADKKRQIAHSKSQHLRSIVSAAPSSRAIATLLDQSWQPTASASMRTVADREDLAAARMQAHTERRILRSLLRREPTANDLALLQQGIGAVQGAELLKPVIAAAYAGPVRLDDTDLRNAHELNAAANAAIGKDLFDIHPTASLVMYQGLWGDAE
jgi:hypothetical protein